MLDSIFLFFTDPVLKAPTIGCILMCIAAALIGVIVFLQKSSLVGETLSHATYPGVIFAAFTAYIFPNLQGSFFPLLILLGAALSAWLALQCITVLQNRFNISRDASLCTILSAFFGIGVTFASYAQFNFSSLYVQIQSYLYGQAATMTQSYVYIYLALALLIIFTVLIAHKEILAINFDPTFSKIIGIKGKWIHRTLSLLLVLAVVIGIRSVGLILMSGMLIAPAITARYLTHSLKKMFLFAAFVGMISGFLGIYLSVNLAELATPDDSIKTLSLPTGPMIILVAAIITLLALLFSPQKGLIIRYFRTLKFKNKCLTENILKAVWRLNCSGKAHFLEISKYLKVSKIRLFLTIHSLVKQGWIQVRQPFNYQLTIEGMKKAEYVIRLHRLWEVYLVNYLGFGEEKVHKSAEEVEHFITPELEAKLTELMDDPKQDPHNQPIPPITGNIL